MKTASEVDALPFTETILLLIFAGLGGVAVLVGSTVPKEGLSALILVPYVALFCYATAAVFVVPIMAIWPSSRRPSYPVAAIWGILSAWCAVASIIGFRELGRWVSLLGFAAAGSASGLLYARLARHRRSS